MKKIPQSKYRIPINDLLDVAISEFQSCGLFRLQMLRKVSRIERFRNKRELKRRYQRLMDDLGLDGTAQREALARLDFGSPEMDRLKSIVSGFLQEVDNRKLLFDRSFLAFFLDQGYLEVAQAFIARVRADDPRLTSEETFQAMRNVWIMNSLQLCWGLPLELTPSVYAYSLLYPYTDNFLDDPDVEHDHKAAFNQRLSAALSGRTPVAASATEERVFALVGQIESQFSRDGFPEVFESLQLIQEAQIESLRQDGDESLTADEILPVSLFKGGTSVLADAYLVKGSLNWKEMHFAFAYGSFLQLLDDFQDAVADKGNRHQTLFSIREDDELLDDQVLSLVAFIFKANAADESDTPIMSLMKEVIRACTLVMVMDAAGRNPGLISQRLYQELESRSKVSLSFYRELEDRVKSLPIDVAATSHLSQRTAVKP